MKDRNAFQRTALLVTFLCVVFSNAVEILAEPPSSEVVYFADIVKFPLPAIPEPVIQGTSLCVLLKAAGDASNWTGKISNEFGSYDLSFMRSYLTPNSLWNISFLMPGGTRVGLFSLTLSFTVGGKSIGIVEPNSVWVLKEAPPKLRLFVFSDLHSPMGAPYFYEAFREMNLIKPDVALVAGDFVDSPTIANGWKLLIGSLLTSRVPLYAASGNHDHEDVGSAVAYSQIVGWLNYSIRIGDFLLVVLPSDSDGWIRTDYITWATNVFRDSPAKFKILMFHHPIFGNSAKELSGGKIELKSAQDLEALVNSDYVYTSYRPHKQELKQLLDLIVEQDVRMVISGHIHTDLNTILIDQYGKKHYFMTLGAMGGSRSVSMGYKIFEVYANGTLDERTAQYDGTEFLADPNSIPIDPGQGVKPNKIGFIQYYYSNNDGAHHAVSFKAINELKQGFGNISVIFKLPKDLPLTSYKWYPSPPASYDVIETQKNYLVILNNVYLPGNSSISFAFASEEDKIPPVATFRRTFLNQDSWIVLTLDASDSGLGISTVDLAFTTDGRTWATPSLTDLISYENGSIALAAWIPVSKQQIDSGVNVTVRANVIDFAGNGITESISTKKTAPPPQQPSLPVEWIGAAVVAILLVAGLLIIVRRRS